MSESRLLQGHLPWFRCAEFLSRLLDLGLPPEVAFKGPDLDALDEGSLRSAARQITSIGVGRPTVHAPFFDLSIGALDPLVQAVTERRLVQSLQAAAQLGAHTLVIHPGFDRWRYPRLEGAWCSNACTCLERLIPLAQGYDCRLALENIYEESPATLVTVVDRMDSPWLGHCFDIGHWQIFGKIPQEEWLPQIQSRLIHLHLHDNLGVNDDHLPIGEGRINFTPLLQSLAALPAPLSMTLEARDPEDLRRSLANLHKLTVKEMCA